MTEFIQPDIIYLQPGEWPEVTWCVDKINNNDVEYLRATPERKAAPEMFEALRHILASESLSLQGGFDDPFDWIESINKVSAALKLATGDNND